MAKDPFKKDPYMKLARRQAKDLATGISQASADLEAYRNAGDNQNAFNIWEITAVITSKYLPSKRIVSANFKTAIQTMVGTMSLIEFHHTFFCVPL